jgi:nucleotide-binding universal stress UspA family protein
VKNVLAYVDERTESDRAVELAVEIARRGRSAAAAMAVVEPLALTFDDGTAPGGGGLVKALVRANEERLTTLAERSLRSGVELDGETQIGTAWLELSRRVLRSGHDLVIKVARGKRRLGWPLFGSTALHLVRKCPAPVWLMAPYAPVAPRRIVAVITPEPGVGPRNEFEREVVAQALAVAELFGAELDVLCSWRVAAEELLVERLDPSRFAHLLEGVRGGVKRALDAILAPFAGRIDASRVRLEKGAPAAVASAFVEAHGTDLVVLGTLPPNAALGMLILEEAEELVQRAPCSVLAIKPDDFRTPVRLSDA